MKPQLVRKFEDLNILFNMGDLLEKEIKREGFCLLVNDKLRGDPYLNFATRISAKGDVNDFINRVEEIFWKRSSKSCFYVMPYTRPKNLAALLLKRGYKIFAVDAWMFFESRELPLGNVHVRKIKSSDLEAYKNVFNEVYTKGEEDDPYKNLSPLYGELTAKRFAKKRQDCKISCYAAFVQNKMVGMVEMAFDKHNAGIYALAVLPKYRKIGAGRSLIAACICDAKKMGIKNTFLQTEKGSRNEKIFKKLGFETRFKGTLYYKGRL